MNAQITPFLFPQSSLSAWTNHKSVVGAVQVLSARLALLEPAHLDHVEGRLHAVHTRMNSISEKKAAIEDADKQSKVSILPSVLNNTLLYLTNLCVMFSLQIFFFSIYFGSCHH